MHTHARSLRVAFALLAVTLLGAACGDDDDATTTTTEPSGTTGATEPAPLDDVTGSTEPDVGGTGAAVQTAESDLGEILTSDGRTLYVFTPDDGGAPTCYESCAATWPALLADGEVSVGDGLDEALFSTVARDDGGEQVTVDGWPLYLYSGDSQPGDVNGQGIGDSWFVVGPDGAQITDDPAG